MSFRFPVMLVILELLPLMVLAWIWLRRGNGISLPLDHAVGRSGRRWWVLVSLSESLPVLLAMVVIAVLCGPVILSEPKTRRRLTNIEFCVDISGSMTASFGSGTRYDASMEAIDGFLDFRDGDAFGLTFFGNSVLHWVPLTKDRSAIRCAPPFMRPEVAPSWFGGTEIGKALRACRQVLSAREEGDRMIILVSDGFSFDLSNGNDQEIAREMNQAGIVVYAIHIGGGGVPDEVVNVTGLTGGEVFQPGDTEGLKTVFQRIDEMQEAQLEKVSAETMDYYWPFSLAGIALLGLTALTFLGLRYTPW